MSKKFLMHVTFNYIKQVDDDCEPDFAEFCIEGSSSCVGNVLNDLNKVAEGRDGCLCGNLESAKFVREATEDDLDLYENAFENPEDYK